MMAQVVGLQAGDFVHTFGDLHLYDNHVEQAKKQLARDPRSLPTLELDQSIDEIDDFQYKHISISGYDPHPPIKAPVAV